LLYPVAEILFSGGERRNKGSEKRKRHVGRFFMLENDGIGFSDDLGFLAVDGFELDIEY